LILAVALMVEILQLIQSESGLILMVRNQSSSSGSAISQPQEQWKIVSQ
jgi:hypothetical protein